MTEPRITINGVALDDGQAMTVRCAVEAFADLARDTRDELGEIGPLYLARCRELRTLMYLPTKGEPR
jgi:hypothetical protein